MSRHINVELLIDSPNYTENRANDIWRVTGDYIELSESMHRTAMRSKHRVKPEE